MTSQCRHEHLHLLPRQGRDRLRALDLGPQRGEAGPLPRVQGPRLGHLPALQRFRPGTREVNGELILFAVLAFVALLALGIALGRRQ